MIRNVRVKNAIGIEIHIRKYIIYEGLTCIINSSGFVDVWKECIWLKYINKS